MTPKSLLLGVLRSNAFSERVFERATFVWRIERGAAMRERAHVARRFLRGEGVEIGALHLPLQLPRGARARYIDRFDRRGARQNYPELRHHKLVRVDAVDDGETLSSIGAKTLDFIVANHMIEHCHNPLGTLENWLGKLKPGGTIFLAVPDQAHSFDRDRAPTSTAHLLRDWREGGQNSLREHYEDWSRHVARLDGPELEAHARQLHEQGENIHFHVWRLADFAELMLAFERELRARESRQNKPVFELELCANNGGEFLVVLRKN